MRAGAEHSVMFLSYRSLQPSCHKSFCRIFVRVLLFLLVLVLLVLVLLVVVLVLVLAVLLLLLVIATQLMLHFCRP